MKKFKSTIAVILSVLMVVSCFPVLSMAEQVDSMGKMYSDSLFSAKSSVYSDKLASLSLEAAFAAAGAESGSNRDASVMAAFAEMGFDSGKYFSSGYDSTASDNIAYAIGTKKLADGADLVAVFVRGGYYDKEMIGNFDTGEYYKADGYRIHKNFFEKAMNVLEGLNGYMSKYGINSSDAKIWIAGYSRGAAVANVVSHFVTAKTVDAGDKYKGTFPYLGFNKDSVYSYLFAVPAAAAPDGKAYLNLQKAVSEIVPDSAKVNIANSSVAELYGKTSTCSMKEYAALREYFNQQAPSGCVLTDIKILSSNGAKTAVPYYGKKGTADVIYNHVISTDPITQVMPVCWGYEPFGKSIVLEGFSSEIAGDSAKAAKFFAISGRNESTWNKNYINALKASEAATVEFAAYLLENDQDVVTHYQPYLKTLVQYTYTSDADSSNAETSIMTALLGVFNKLQDESALFLKLGLVLKDSNTITDPSQQCATDQIIEKAINDKINLTTIATYLLSSPDTSDGEAVAREIVSRFVSSNCDSSYDASAYGGSGKASLDKSAFTESILKVIKETFKIDFLNIGDLFEQALCEHFPQYYKAVLISYAEENVGLTLSFETNGGSAIESLQVSEGQSVDLAAYKPVRNGYEFVGWFMDKDFTKPVGVISVSADTVIYAKWAPISINFTDVTEKDYFYNAVIWAVQNNITKGLSDTQFGPDKFCTRAQTVTFMWRAAGCPAAKSTSNPFTDVDKSDYCYDAVMWAVGEEITSGTSKTTFAPNATVTREQFVTFLWRMAKSPSASAANPFTDVKSGDYFYNAVIWAVNAGITQGVSADKFGTGAGCTRGQTVTFLERYCSKDNDSQMPSDL